MTSVSFAESVIRLPCGQPHYLQNLKGRVQSVQKQLNPGKTCRNAFWRPKKLVEAATRWSCSMAW